MNCYSGKKEILPIIQVRTLQLRVFSEIGINCSNKLVEFIKRNAAYFENSNTLLSLCHTFIHSKLPPRPLIFRVENNFSKFLTHKTNIIEDYN